MDHSATNGSTLILNGVHTNGFHQPTIEDLERELPLVYDGQIPLGEVLSRVVQSIYAELSELAETMPNMSDSARKRTLADWVVKTKKQVVKLYAVMKWARDAATVQKCMNITAFLLDQNRQFEDAIAGLNYARQSLDPARLRNHDLLTSLDVLTTGSYRRLPSTIKNYIIPKIPLSDADVVKTLKDMEDAIRFRLRLTELIPIEMSKHRIADGRVYFTVPKLFETSLCLRGAQKDEGWFFVHIEFLLTIGGDLTGMQEFPREPKGIIKRHITDEADARLAFYLPGPADQPPPGVEMPPRPKLPDNVVDTPLVRVFNFLQMMALSYQLEILWYQAERMRSLGWADYLRVEMSANRKTLTLSYWIRKPPPVVQGRAPPKLKLPALGGTLTIAIVEAHGPGGGPARSPKSRILSELQLKAKLGGARPSDEVEGLKLEVKWQPSPKALGVDISVEDASLPKEVLSINVDDLDVDKLLRSVIDKHTEGILKINQFDIQRGPGRNIFYSPESVSLLVNGDTRALRVHLCADEVVLITIDPRTGRLTLRDTGDLAAAGRAPRFIAISDRLNENPDSLVKALIQLRLQTITDMVEQKANYLGLQTYRSRNFAKNELQKLGPAARGTLYIQLANFPSHYLVIVITDSEFQYVLMTTSVVPESMYGSLIMGDIAWLDFRRVHGQEIVVTANTSYLDSDSVTKKRKRNVEDDSGRESSEQKSFNLDTRVIRELYAYCCARVASMNVERQFKLRGIPFTYVSPSDGLRVTSDSGQIQSSLSRSVPALCVQSKDILAGAPAAEAAMPNIRVIPLNWWSKKKAQVVTCVKLKYVQQPLGKTASTSAVIRPSKRIIYDTTEAVVSFLSENVNTCVDEFLEEWARVSKMVVIAREVAKMAEDHHWADVRLLSFDLQTVEFAYAADYTVSITCTDPLSTSGGDFDLRFSRCSPDGLVSHQHNHTTFNPHDDAEPFLSNILRHGQGRLSPSLHRLVSLLRNTLPIVIELEEIRNLSDQDTHIEVSQGLYKVDTFAKSAGWYRMLYSDLKHALDFRSMTDQRIAIVDASHSLYHTDLVETETDAQSKTPDKGLGLQPMPDFRTIVLEAVREVLADGKITIGRIAVLDVGVICDVNAARALGRAIHMRVLERFKG